MGIFTIPIYVMQKPDAERDAGMFWGEAYRGRQLQGVRHAVRRYLQAFKIHSPLLTSAISCRPSFRTIA